MKRRFYLGVLLAGALAACTAGGDATGAADPGAQVVLLNSDNFEQEVYLADVPVLVDFTATWCVPCKVVDPIVESLAPEMAGRAKIGKLDIDESPDIYRGLRVNGVPHVLFFRNGEEQDRIAGVQSRETYVDYLEAMIAGESAFDASLSFLDNDAFRRHFVVSRPVEHLERALPERPDLLVEPFENGQTPLSLILISPSVRQNAQIDLALAHDPVISTADLAGLGRCDELEAALADDPEASSRPDPDGASPLWVALMRSHRLADRSCLRTLLDAGADPSGAQDRRFQLARPVILREDIELLREFLERGLDPESTDDEGYNMLHWASLYGMVDGARLLLERGMDPGAETLQGQTALDIVLDRRQRRMEALEEVESEEHRTQLAETLTKIDEMIELLEG
ncbi:MAG: hypothetical protein F4060_00820 [Holophagales bacterium]|nr:thioredoxin domain-containing protein [Acidobacteriota bacterium]MYA06708.1 hypothetical protein [Holophagales bacterium]MYG32372.1 hypothetical protein [Holophagales bacterium]MYI78460.1 hypothetical protein [Holophagales bacterium]